jgi:CHASE3 domain sensor protein
MMKDFIERNIFDPGFAAFLIVMVIFFGLGSLIYNSDIESTKRVEIRAEKAETRDAREDAAIVDLIKSGKSYPEAYCALKGC